MGNPTLSKILKAGADFEQIRQLLRRTSKPFAVLLVDLCGSTELKQRQEQEEWLPEICRFLQTVSDVVSENHGRVIKYIGDEVMGVFTEDANQVAVPHAETCIWACCQRLASLRPASEAKFAMDYGTAAEVDFGMGPVDSLGTCVDRCARIARLALPGTLLASEELVRRSRNAGSWKKIGAFKFKGIRGTTRVFQMKKMGPPIKIADPELWSRSTKEIVDELMAARGEVTALRDALRRATQK